MDTLDILVQQNQHVRCPSRDEILRAVRPVVLKQVVEMFDRAHDQLRFEHASYERAWKDYQFILEQLREEAEK